MPARASRSVKQCDAAGVQLGIQLHTAAKRGDCVCVSSTLNAINIHVQQRGNLYAAEKLINLPIGASRRTAFHIACEKGHVGVVCLLLMPGVGTLVNQEARQGITGFGLACRRGHVGVVSLLLEWGARDGNALAMEEFDHLSPLENACAADHVGVVCLLLPYHHHFPNLLGLACQAGSRSVMDYLLRVAEVDVNGGTSKHALHWACMGGDIDIIHTLTQHPGIQMDCLDDSGHTPLYYACSYGHFAVVKHLVEWDVDVGRRGNDAWMPLHVACFKGHANIVTLLLQQLGIAVNAMAIGRSTPLACACQGGHPDVVRLLLVEGGADTSIACEGGGSALHCACDMSYDGWGSCDVIRLLLRWGKEGVDLCAFDD